MSEKLKCAENGAIEIHGVDYPSITLSDMNHHYIRVFVPGGREIEFLRNPKVYLRQDMEAALIRHGILTEAKNIK